MKFLLLSLICAFPYFLSAQNADKKIKDAVSELTDFIALPNFGLDKQDIEKNIAWIESAFQKRGMQCEVLQTEGNPLLLAHKEIDSKLPTVLFYMHLDGQAVDSKKWDQGSPFAAVIKRKNTQGEWEEVESDEGILDRDWRIFGRSASDDKGPIIAFLHAIDRLNDEQVLPQFNIKIILDAEEEIGSKSLPAAVIKYREKLAADVLVINDGPVHTSGSPTLTFGCRGITTINLTTYGPIRPQHSGHYGNYAPNPIFKMAHLLGSMKNKDGTVAIDGYYDGIALDEKTKEILSKVPDDEDKIKDYLQIVNPEKVGSNYQESLQYPSLNARGINAGWVGAKARTIVPDIATVAIDIRLVPESEPNRLVALIKEHAESEGYHVVDHEPTYEERKKYPNLLYFYHARNTLPFRTDMDAPAGEWLTRAVQNTFDTEPIKIRIMGGTVPIAAFINELNIPAIIVPMVNPDNNQHSPNENLRIGHFEDAIKLFYGIFTTKL